MFTEKTKKRTMFIGSCFFFVMVVAWLAIMEFTGIVLSTNLINGEPDLMFKLVFIGMIFVLIVIGIFGIGMIGFATRYLYKEWWVQKPKSPIREA